MATNVDVKKLDINVQKFRHCRRESHLNAESSHDENDEDVDLN